MVEEATEHQFAKAGVLQRLGLAEGHPLGARRRIDAGFDSGFRYVQRWTDDQHAHLEMPMRLNAARGDQVVFLSNAQLDAAHVFPKKIVTLVQPLKAFYDGEDYHQGYAEKNPDNPYIQVCDIPKIAGLKEQFPELFQDYKHK